MWCVSQCTFSNGELQFNLAWKLALVVKNNASPNLLTSYEAERMPVVAEMLNLSNALHAKAFPHIPAAAFETPQTSDNQPDPMTRSRKLLQLGINYRWSDILFDERVKHGRTADKNPYSSMDAQIRVGDRAPYIGNLIGEKTTDLFSLLEEVPSHLVLVFPSSTLASMESLSSIKTFIDAGLIRFVAIIENQASGSDNVEGVKYLVDSQSTAREAYDVSEPDCGTYVTIRPDGIIGAYTFEVGGIKEYFARLGVI